MCECAAVVGYLIEPQQYGHAFRESTGVIHLLPGEKKRSDFENGSTEKIDR